MKNPESKCGTAGWTILTAGIIAWDLIADETLSHAYDRYLEKPISRVFAVGAVAVTGLHLLNQLPECIDPITQAYRGAEWLVRRVFE